MANGTTAVVDLTATIGASGTLSGSGQSGGVHLSGETGWVCQFTFTATQGAASGTTGQTENVGAFYSPTKNISCQILPDYVYCQQCHLVNPVCAGEAPLACCSTRVGARPFRLCRLLGVGRCCMTVESLFSAGRDSFVTSF